MFSGFRSLWMMQCTAQNADCFFQCLFKLWGQISWRMLTVNFHHWSIFHVFWYWNDWDCLKACNHEDISELYFNWWTLIFNLVSKKDFQGKSFLTNDFDDFWQIVQGLLDQFGQIEEQGVEEMIFRKETETNENYEWNISIMKQEFT